MNKVARKNDSVDTGHSCDTTTTLDTPSQGFVFIDDVLVATLGDLTVSHTHPVGESCVPHTASITSSSSLTYINGVPIARLGDSCDLGSITSGSDFVYSD